MTSFLRVSDRSGTGGRGPAPGAAPDALRLACEPAADCDSLRRHAHDPVATA